MTLEDATRLVAIRATTMFSAEPGAMLALELSAEEVTALLDDDVELAAHNGPRSVVVAGPHHAIERLERRLDGTDIPRRSLRTSHAFHTASMDQAAETVARTAASMTMATPAIPLLSNVTGHWFGPAELADPSYWGRQVRAPVLFDDGLRLLLDDGPRAFVEVGPAATLVGLVTSHPERTSAHQARSLLPPRTGLIDDARFAFSTRAWLTAIAQASGD